MLSGFGVLTGLAEVERERLGALGGNSEERLREVCVERACLVLVDSSEVSASRTRSCNDHEALGVGSRHEPGGGEILEGGKRNACGAQRGGSHRAPRDGEQARASLRLRGQRSHASQQDVAERAPLPCAHAITHELHEEHGMAARLGHERVEPVLRADLSSERTRVLVFEPADGDLASVSAQCVEKRGAALRSMHEHDGDRQICVSQYLAEDRCAVGIAPLRVVDDDKPRRTVSPSRKELRKGRAHAAARSSRRLAHVEPRDRSENRKGARQRARITRRDRAEARRRHASEHSRKLIDRAIDGDERCGDRADDSGRRARAPLGHVPTTRTDP